MCQLCNGTYVIHIRSSYGIKFETCPICGPVPADEQQAKLIAIYREVEAINANKVLEGA